MNRISNTSCPPGFQALPSVDGAVWHKFEKGVAMLFPFGIPGVTSGTILVNLYNDNNELVGSWTTAQTDNLTKAALHSIFGRHEFSRRLDFSLSDLPSGKLIG